jgi:hypothetical protein
MNIFDKGYIVNIPMESISSYATIDRSTSFFSRHFFQILISRNSSYSLNTPVRIGVSAGTPLYGEKIII